MPSDSSGLDNALVAKLGADATLLALLPNGVYMDEAPSGSTRFVIVSVIDAVDVAEFGRTAYEDVLYAVDARVLSTSGGNVQAAAAQIHTLLHDQPLTVPGYGYMTLHREARLRQTEVDAIDPTIRWFRRGGRYRLQMALT